VQWQRSDCHPRAARRLANGMTPDQRALYGQAFDTFANKLNSMQSGGLDAVLAAARVIELAELVVSSTLMTLCGSCMSEGLFDRLAPDHATASVGSSYTRYSRHDLHGDLPETLCKLTVIQ
jgi:hypothetical protein